MLQINGKFLFNMVIVKKRKKQSKMGEHKIIKKK